MKLSKKQDRYSTYQLYSAQLAHPLLDTKFLDLISSYRNSLFHDLFWIKFINAIE